MAICFNFNRELASSVELSFLVLFMCYLPGCLTETCPTTSQERTAILATAEHLMAIGQLHQALACGESLASLYPKDPIGFDVLARVCFLGGDNTCCIRFSERSSALHEQGSVEWARSQIRLANCQAATENWGSALASYSGASACRLLPGDELATAYNNLGNVLRMLQRNEEAVEQYLAAAAALPTFADAYFNAGGLLVEAGRVEEGTAALWEAVGLEAGSGENWGALAGALDGAGHAEAGRAYMTATRLRVEGGGRWGKEELMWGRWAVRSGDVETGLRVARRVLRALEGGAAREAEEVGWVARVAQEVAGAGEKGAGRALLERVRGLAGLTGGELRGLGAALAGNEFRDYDAAAAALREAWEGGSAGALGGLLAALQTTCDWEGVEALVGEARGRREGEGGWVEGAGLGPYEGLYLGLAPRELLALARAAAEPLNAQAAGGGSGWWGGAPGWVEALGQGGAGRGAGRVVVGLLSSDMKLSHPIGQLLVPVLRGLGAAGLAVVCVDTHWRGRRSSAAWEEEVQAACGGGMVRAGRWGVREGGERLNGLRVHVVVNLNGWAGEDRNHWLAARPAPVQVNALGYPGPSGCRFMDLLLADPVAAPPDLAAPAPDADRLLLLPPSHHPLPHRFSFGAAPPADALSREEVGLPAAGSGAVVAGCFNRLKKLDRRTWVTWEALLRALPAAVLWLSGLALSPQAEARLRGRLLGAGLGADRLVVSAPFASQQHLATKAHADILLDTPRYNGHLSAGDALWAGLPMVVLPGESLAARVSASLAPASAAVFVARSLSDYLDIALALLRNPPARASLRAALAEERVSGANFDTPLWARRLAAAFRLALDLRLAGPFPAHVVLRRAGES